MSRSVPSPSSAQATFAATLIDQWVREGLRDVVLSPGSRSTPLALAVASHPGLRLHVRLDERSAGFFGIGRALASGRPVALVTTSGTAAAELHASVAEADQAHVPLLVLTADRPPELQGVGAPQTIEQTDLYGSMVRRFEEPGVATSGDDATWRPLAQRLWRDARGANGPAGPVHLNAAFVEPLVGEPYELPDALAALATPDDVPDVRGVDLRGKNVLAIVGSGVSALTIESAHALNWAVVGDATACATLAHVDALLRVDSFAAAIRPDVVVRLGGLPASKVLAERWRTWALRTIALDGSGPVADPERLITETHTGLPSSQNGELRANGAYPQRWRDASARVTQWLDASSDRLAPLSEPALARAVVARANATSTALVVGSSMPVRDVEWWSEPRLGSTYANRGVNGIDGVVSTVLGVAAGHRAIGLVGDLTMLHDVSGLVEGLGAAGGSCALVVADNGGGGIFSFLPQASAVPAAVFAELFATPRRHDLLAVATAFGHRASEVRTIDELDIALERALSYEGVTVVVARVPSHDENVELHHAWNDQVERLLAAP